MMKMVKLFELGKIGVVELRNRIVMPAMSTLLASETGAVTQRLIDYYVERARGGVGLIIVEATCVDSPVGKLASIQLCVDDDRFIAGLSELAEAVHGCDVKIALQLHHAGRQTTLRITGGIQPVSASNVSCDGVNARELTIKEVEELVNKFAEGAYRAKVAGFDAVEFHGAHGYLINQFLSPYTNKRKDKYGGTFDGRMRFALEVLEQSRKKVGISFPLTLVISADEYVEGGLTLEESKRVASRLEEAGVSAIHVSAGVYESRWWCSQPIGMPSGCLIPLAEEIKKVVKVPVIAVGKIVDPVLAESVIREGKADFVAMGRALIADPELPRKAAEGRLRDIRKCIGCMVCADTRKTLGLPMRCTVNAAVGREGKYEIKPSASPKKILVVGGGPAGMEAARVLAIRGHEVALFERAEALGGQLLLSSAAPSKQEMRSFREYLIDQLMKLGVEINLNKDVDLRTVKEMKPDVVVLATGAVALIPEIPGIQHKTVVTGWDVLAERVEVGGTVIVAGGGSVGCEVAEFLADKEVTIVEMLGELGVDMEPRPKILLVKRLVEQGVKMLLNTKVKEITDNGVVVIDEKSIRRALQADNVVLALGSVANNKLACSLRDKVPRLYSIGDCVKPRKVLEAVGEAYRVACEI